MGKAPESRGGFYYANNFYYSPAYQSLTKNGRNLLHDLIAEIDWANKNFGGRGKKWCATNKGELSFSESQFRKRYQTNSSSCYLNARNKLIEVGLIRQTYRGGKFRGDMSKYKMLFVVGVLTTEQRWKRFPSENWEAEIPKSPKNLIGKNTRFKQKSKVTPLEKGGINGVTPLEKGVITSHATPSCGVLTNAE